LILSTEARGRCPTFASFRRESRLFLSLYLSLHKSRLADPRDDG
jgi:hypothetical protein